jgi:hypothetical protein
MDFSYSVFYITNIFSLAEFPYVLTRNDLIVMKKIYIIEFLNVQISPPYNWIQIKYLIVGVKVWLHACLTYHYIQMSAELSALWASEPISRVKGEESLVPAANLKPLPVTHSRISILTVTYRLHLNVLQNNFPQLDTNNHFAFLISQGNSLLLLSSGCKFASIPKQITNLKRYWRT